MVEDQACELYGLVTLTCKIMSTPLPPRGPLLSSLPSLNPTLSSLPRYFCLQLAALEFGGDFQDT